MSYEQLMLENELTALSISLKPSRETLEEGKRNATKLFELLKRKSNFKIDRVGIFGSVKKKSSIKVDFDFDCVIFINDVLPPYDDVTEDFEDVLLMEENLNGYVIKNRNTVQVIINNIKYDIVPATNFSPDKNLQRELVMQRIRNLENPSRDGHKFSSSLDETQTEFIRNQSEFAHNFIRLAKFWNKTLFIKRYFSGRSSMIEAIALYVAKEEQRKYSNVSILRAFREFLQLMTNLDNLNIVFGEHYSFNEVDDYIRMQRPLVLDPSNPYNNLAYPFIQKETVKDDFEQFAAITISRLEQFFRDLNVNAIFDPQPLQAPIEDVRRSVPPIENWLFTVEEENSNKNPNVIIRNEREAKTLGVEIIKHYLIRNINTFNLNIPLKMFIIMIK
ncbi:2'-5'-oligoadenylate synthase 3-like [Centruroides vittatus]|uniref:2'-5'-oligoadenylate synthase 3-like n=1 Tax=Centruroides vittatus TaxID=120091 RepID=UPI00350F023A